MIKASLYNSLDHENDPFGDHDNFISDHPSTKVTSDTTETTYSRRIVIEDSQDKVKEVGLPELPCILCDLKDPIAFDLSIHYQEKHAPDLVRLPIGEGNLAYRGQYAVELSKQKLGSATGGGEDYTTYVRSQENKVREYLYRQGEGK